ncbi:MAG TPA: hypothetical protein DCE56_03210 [Cyanobacteria bacterium UBA8553]|nr:hypothetical protein [Cyanobacteria bacterium UBA8553]HAJ62916.1 hypothetical protein [Cyanobacteria bacterium UBA8543]
MRRITSYQALWRPVENKGHFWFTYSDGDRERTMDLDPESFRTMMKVLDTDKPIFADHSTSVIAVNSQPNDCKVKALS